jgi:predicted O-linked N-acetylglucosamine transferase (SPINDLY family)
VIALANLSESLALALADHQQGRLQQAAARYQQILAVNPRHADALHLLGVVSHQSGDWDAAARLIGEAIAQNRDVPFFYNSLGNLLSDQGRHQEALEAFQQALRLCPENEEFLLNHGSTLYALGLLEEATEAFRQALSRNPHMEDAWNNLANALKDQGQWDEAIEAYQQATRVNPRYAEPHFNLGNLYRDRLLADQPATGETDPPFEPTANPETDTPWIQLAMASYQRAVQCDPQFLAAYINLGWMLNFQRHYEAAAELYQAILPKAGSYCVEVYNNLANALQGLERWTEAESAYREALAQKPDYADAWINLGTAYKKQGRLADAIACFQEVTQLTPSSASAYFTLGTLYFQQDQLDPAITAFRQALERDPKLMPAYGLLGIALSRLDRAEEAIACYQQAYNQDPRDAFRIKQAIITPCIYESEADRLFWRSRVRDGVRQLAESHRQQPLRVDNPIAEIGSANFYQAYHGENDREFQALFASLFEQTPKFPAPPRRKNAKPRVGFISRLLRPRHTIGELNQGFIDHLDRTRFDVTVFLVDDPINRNDPIHVPDGDHLVWLPEFDMQEACRRISDEAVDILFYTDIGMDPVTFYLAFNRLAPVQCVTWGHPMTTGIPEMDYFISWQHAEMPDCQDHYTEKVVTLKHYTSYFYRPTLPEPIKTREQLGLDPQATLYICAQTLFKLQPEFDAILADILRRDPNGQLVCIHMRYPQLGQKLMRRWQLAMPDVVDRIRFVNRLSDDDFLAFQAQADVLLDPTIFVGGTTSLEAFAFGTPIVTLPSPYLRGRWTVAFYQQMGIMDCVAQTPEEYVEIAVRLGTDKPYREAIKTRLLERVSPLFENMAIVRELESFFDEALQAAEQSPERASFFLP